MTGGTGDGPCRRIAIGIVDHNEIALELGHAATVLEHIDIVEWCWRRQRRRRSQRHQRTNDSNMGANAHIAITSKATAATAKFRSR